MTGTTAVALALRGFRGSGVRVWKVMSGCSRSPGRRRGVLMCRRSRHARSSRRLSIRGGEAVYPIEAVMEQQVNDIIEAFRAALRDRTADGQSFQTSLAALQALVPVTELDRMHHLLGVVRLLEALLEITPAEGTEPVRAQRAQTFDVLMRQYGSTDTPYIRSRTIVEDVAARLAAAHDRGDGEAGGARFRRGRRIGAYGRNACGAVAPSRT